MFRSKALATTLLAVVMIAPSALAQTVGFVDTARVLTSYKGAQSAQAQMRGELKTYQSQFADRQKKIAAAQKAGKSPAEIDKLTQKYEAELAPYKQRAASLEQRLSADVKTRIEGKINQIAKQRHVDLVLDKAAVLYGGTDLTSDVIRALQ